MKYARFLLPVWMIVGLSLVVLQANAQSPSGTKKKDKKPGGLTVETAFQPAFYCSPAVNRLQARKGQRVKFEFKMTPVREAVRISVRPVALRQFETGVLKADLDSPAPAEVRLDGPGQYDLPIGSEVKLTGSIKLPNNDSDFHSFGILVQDNGYLADERGQADEASFGVKFVSQYILRCDVEITNGRGTDIRNLQIESAELAEINGVPSASVMVFNPTESTIEFEIQSRLRRDGYIENEKDVKLFARINANENPPERYRTRIFPKTRLEMVSGWPAAVFPGDYQMISKITRKRKTILETASALTVGADDFPAQAAYATQVAAGVHVHPAQILLSRKRGSKRFIPLHLTNYSTQAVELEIQSVDPDGQPLDWLLVRPDTISLQPGEKRKSMVSLKALADQQSHRYGFLEFIERGSDSAQKTSLAVAFQGTNPFIPKLATNALRIDYALNGGSLIVDALNQSELPLPVDASIQFKSSSGNTEKVRAGYGAWLLPGRQRRLEFKIETSVTEGDLPVLLTFVDASGQILAQREYVLNVEKPFEEVADNPRIIQ